MNTNMQKAHSTPSMQSFRCIWKKYQYDILTCFIVAFVTYAFAFANKFSNYDDTRFFFSHGASLDSGRWGLDILECFFPNYSMPWLLGWETIVLLTIAICVILDFFSIRNQILRCLLAATIIAFPSEIGTMLYMFTSVSYSLAFLFSISAAYLADRGGRWGYFISLILITFSLSIYQAYVAVTASFFVLRLMQMILENEQPNIVFRKGIRFLSVLVISLLTYCSITFVLLSVAETGLNSWATRATTTDKGIVHRTIHAWKQFLAMIIYRNYGLITSGPSWAAHIICLAVTGGLAVIRIGKRKKFPDLLFFMILAGILFPLSINAIALLIGENGIHTLTLYSFISVYLFMGIVCKQACDQTFVTRVVCIGLAVTLLSNIHTANKVFFKQYMISENTKSFYTTIVTQIQMTPGYNENCKIAIIGSVQDDSDYLSEFGHDDIYGVWPLKSDGISSAFISHYLGVDLNYADADLIKEIQKDSRYLSMPVYPYYGYIQKIDDCIIIKLGSAS